MTHPRHMTFIGLGMLGMTLAIFAPPAAAAEGVDAKELQAVLDRAIAFLKKEQGQDGSFSPRLGGPGVSALVVAGLLQNGVSADEPVVAKALAYMEKRVKGDGGIYDRGLANYTTSVALLAFKEANAKGKYDTLIQNASKFLKSLQFDESLVEDKDVKFGGVGYDKSQRPDLSNTQLFIDALVAAGIPKTDPAFQRALKFVSRCQNLPGETNDQPFALNTTDDDRGGATYTPVDPEKSQYKTDAGGLRSLGGMTYAGLKTFLYAGVSKEDQRVKAAIAWIRRHYTVDENPGQGQAGLYYYYHTFAKAMDALGENPFSDSQGKKHDWRRELFEALKKRQGENGGWSNADKQFGENDGNLATAFALLALSYCRTPQK